MENDLKKDLTRVIDLKYIKDYLDSIEKSSEKRERYLKAVLLDITAKEDALELVGKKLLDAAKGAEEQSNIIKNEFVPNVISLMNKFRNESIAFEKRIASLEHQLKKLK